MRYRFLGATGIKVSELCLGTMTFGREASEAESFRMLDRFYEVGGNFLDSADVYAGGASEVIVGKWLKTKPRDQLVVATKVRFGTGTGVNDVGLSRKHIMDNVHRSLRQLGTDYLDLYQVHAWDPKTPLVETMGVLNDLVHAGLVRYIGASNFRAWQLAEALLIARENHWAEFRCLQPQYNLLCRAPEYELFPWCERQGLGVIPWSPLRGGWLSGKYRRDMTAPPANTRVFEAEAKGWGESWKNTASERTWHIVETLLEVARETGKSSAQVALNWTLRRDVVSAPIIGARTFEQLEDNLMTVEWRLDPALAQKLDEASDTGVSYPYDAASERQQQAGREN